MACRFTYKGKTYDRDGLVAALKEMSPAEASKFIPGVKSIPSAPFVGNTEAWSTLAFRRMLRWAAENGYSSVSWTPGEVQAERYDLSKQIKQVIVEKHTADYGTVTYQVNAYDLNDNKIINRIVSKPEEIADLIGKEATDKAMAQIDVQTRSKVPRADLRGLDLKVGGEGMKGFYDSLLVSVANKLGKKFGAKVGQTKINPITEIWDQAAKKYTAYDTPQPGTGTTVHNLPITDAMRESVMQGQPLFKRGANPARYVISDKQRKAITAAVQAEAQRTLGHRLARVELVNSPADLGGSEGIFDADAGVVYIALQAGSDPVTIFRHEAIHVLRDAGVITKPEWAALSKRADEEWIKKYQIRERYDEHYKQVFDVTEDQHQELLREEAIAEAFADYQRKPEPSTFAGRIFKKVMDFLNAVRRALGRMGFNTPEDIFEAADLGQIAARPRKEGPGRGFVPYAREAPAQGKLAMAGHLPAPRNPKPGTFEAPAHDERIRDALMDSTDTMLNRIKRGGKAAGTVFRVGAQDRELHLLRTQQAIKAAGKAIPEAQDAYLAASLYPGRVAQMDEDLVKQVLEPLVEDIHKAGLTLDDVDQFNKARHAPERNQVIGEIYKPGEQFYDATVDPSIVGGSGFSDNQARDILDAFKKNGKYQKLKQIGDRIVSMNRKNVDLLYSSGLISQEQHDHMLDQYQYYVPLRGYDDPAIENPDSMRTGKRFDTRGKEFRQAFGRTSQADSSTAYSFLQAREAIIRAEKNRVGKRLLTLAQANPNEAVWQVNQRRLMRHVDKSTGLVHEIHDPTTQLADNVFVTKVGGKSYAITLHNPGLARAMKGLGGENMGEIVAALSKIMRVLAATRTSYDPEFIMRNLLRDTQEAAINLQEEGVRALATKVIKDIPNAIAGMNRMLKGDSRSTHWAKAAREFADAGGKIGFMNRGDIESQKATLNRLMAEMSPTMSRQVWMGVRDQVFERINRWNDSVENALRLATYVHLRNAGVSQDKAAFAARELTVNFNRKGEWSPALNSVLMFFNARVQGAASVAMRLKRSKKVQKVVLGIVIGAVLQGLLNHWMAGDDDDKKNRYDKIPDDVKQRQFILMLPKDLADKWGMEYVHFPLPPGYGMFHVVGTQIAQALTGARTPLESAANIASGIGNAFNPLNAGSFIQGLVPTLLSPFADMYANRDYFGKPIEPEDYTHKKPHSQRFTPNVSPVAKTVAQGMGSLTGGNEVRPGGIDVSPNQVQYLFDFVTGGIGQLFSRASAVAGMVQSGEPVDLSRVPFVRVFAGQSSKYADQDAYYEITKEVQMAKDELKLRNTQHDAAAAAKVRKDHAKELALGGLVHAQEKIITDLKAEIRKVDNRPGLTPEARQTRRKALQDRVDKAMLLVRTRWNSWKPPAP